jgi:hypothetical protein
VSLYSDISPTVTRYVVTHVGGDGLRTLSHGAQGRNTYAEKCEAILALSAMLANNSRSTLESRYGKRGAETFEVRACECWVAHFDPCAVYFDDEPDHVVDATEKVQP